MRNQIESWQSELHFDLNTGRWDQSKPPNAGQQAPLLPEFQAKLDAAMARAMLVYETMRSSSSRT